MSDVRCPRCGALVEAWTTGPLTCPSCGFTKKVRPTLMPKSPRHVPRALIVAVAVILIVAGVGTALVYLPGSPLHRKKAALAGDLGLQRAVAGTLGLRHESTITWTIDLFGNGNASRAAYSATGPRLESSHNDTAGVQGSGLLEVGTVANLVADDGSVRLGRDERPRPEDVGNEVFDAIARVFTDASVSASKTETVSGRTLTHFTAASDLWDIEAWASAGPPRLVMFNATGVDGVLDGKVTLGGTLAVSVDAALEERAPFAYVKNETVSDDGARISGRIGSAQRFEVKLSEVELRLADEGSSGPFGDAVASLRLDHGRAAAKGYALSFTDVDKDGLVSAGDRYDVQLPADATEVVYFFDLWADNYGTDETAV